MANYLLDQTGAEVQALLDAVQNPETTQPVQNSGDLITSGAVYAGQAALSSELSALGQEVGRYKIPITESGKYIVTSNGVGNHIGGVTSAPTYSYMRFPVTEGDKVIVNGTGGGNPRLWCFIDSSEIILSASNGYVSGSNLELIAPTNAAEIIINTTNTSTPSYYVSKDSVEARLDEEINEKETELRRSFSSSYPSLGGSVPKIANAIDAFVLTNVELVNGHRYRARVITSPTLTAPSTMNLKVTSDSSGTSIYDIAHLGGQQISEKVIDFDWRLTTGKTYRVAFYGGAVNQQVVVILQDITTDVIFDGLLYRGHIMWVQGGINAGAPGTSPNYARTAAFQPCKAGVPVYLAPMPGYTYQFNIYYYTDKDFDTYTTSPGYATVSTDPVSVTPAIDGYYMLSVVVTGVNPITEAILDLLPIYFNNVQSLVDVISNLQSAISWGVVERNRHKESALVSVVARSGSEGIKVADKLSLLHLSDIHGNTANLKNVVTFWDFYASLLDDAIHTGDSVSNFYADTDPFQAVDGAEKVLNVIGNHDAWIQGDTDYNATEKQTYDKIFAPSIANWGVTQPTGAESNGYCYYYKDYTTAKFRLIVLDSVHWHYRNGVSQTNAAQKSWFESVLADAITQNLRVICATHYTPQNGIVPVADTGFNVLGATAGAAIADGWYAVDEMFGCVDTFIGNGGKFAGWIVGHTHNDYFGSVYGHTNQPIVIIGTSGGSSPNNKFISGTASQDNFNIITFENINSKDIIKVLKIGQDTDIYTRSKNTIAYNFTDGVLIATN